MALKTSSEGYMSLLSPFPFFTLSWRILLQQHKHGI